MSCEASTGGSGEVLCAKSTFFPLLLNRTREARALCGFQHHEGENRFCFLFSDPISSTSRICLPSNSCTAACCATLPTRARLRHHHEPIGCDCDGVDYEGLVTVLAVAIAAFTKLNHNLSRRGQRAVGVWENLDRC